jgi:hypothetical protein
MSARYPLVPVPCSHCRAHDHFGDVRHERSCPSESGNLSFFTHPDLMDLEVHISAFYPEI